MSETIMNLADIEAIDAAEAVSKTNKKKAVAKKKAEAPAEDIPVAEVPAETEAAKTEAPAAEVPVEAEEVAPEVDMWEKVEVMVPRGYAVDDPNFFVGVNGRSYVFPKGKKVRVPRFIAIEMERAERAQQKWDEKSAAMASAE